MQGNEDFLSIPATAMSQKSKGKHCKKALVGRKLFHEGDDDPSDEDTKSIQPSQHGQSLLSCELRNRVTLPEGMEVEFHPTKLMNLDKTELEVAAYIFSSKLDKEYVLCFSIYPQ